MNQVEIVHIESYRRRRDARYRCALALHANEPDRSKILEHLWRASALAGADRGAVVWLDEYGPSLAHPHTLLDLGADRPRRQFFPAPLRAAWQTRVPGLLDLSRAKGSPETSGEGIASMCAVALGSDGPRSWFLVLDSLTPRQPLPEGVVGELMFLAGEVASIVLHRDLDEKTSSLLSGRLAETGDGSAFGSFSGWPVLKDLEGLSRGDEVSRKIGNRFLVARIIRGLVDDDLVSDPESLALQVSGARQELEAFPGGGEEVEVWDRVLRSVEAHDFPELLAAMLRWGRLVEGQGHLNGAIEILGLAFELARATGSHEAATDAARFQAKVFRSRADWAEALGWYGLARGIAEESEDSGKLAAVLDGLANAHRDRGALPKAHEVLLEVLEIGEKTGDRYAVAIGHHDLMTVEKLRGNNDSAIQHGWLAVQAYDSRDGRLRALFDLAGVLRESGELSAAWDAYSVVEGQMEGLEARILALDAMAFIAALRGDRSRHEALRRKMEIHGWEKVAPVYRGQVLYYRGLSCRALGDEAEGHSWLAHALRFAEEHGLNKLIFDAEEALKMSGPSKVPGPTQTIDSDSPSTGIGDVRRGLRELREAQATVGGAS